MSDTARLCLVSGVPDGFPRVHGLALARTTVGRAQDCDIQLPATSLVSRLHFVIEREDVSDGSARFFLVDESCNGVYIDGERAPKRVRCQLRDGALLALGTGAHCIEPTTLRFAAPRRVGALGASNAPAGAAPLGAADESPSRGDCKASAPTPATRAAMPASAGVPPRTALAAWRRAAAEPNGAAVHADEPAMRRLFDEGSRQRAHGSAARQWVSGCQSPPAAPDDAHASRGASPPDPPRPRAARPLSPVGRAECASDDSGAAGGSRGVKRAASDDESPRILPGFVARAKRGANAHVAAVRGANKPSEGDGALAAEFGAPPLSILDARTAQWRERRSYWIDGYGIQSELGRPTDLLGFGGRMRTKHGGTSVFDPMLCELAYRWWAPPGGSILDPFAGGSVRGVVAARLGLAYHGIELSATQITANEAQARRIGAECTAARVPWVRPKWMRADATHLDGTALHARLPAAVDFVFTCPPYYDLERYSNDGRDLCNAPSYAAFLRALDKALGGALQLLRRDRFACVVVGELRDRRTGLCRNFVSDTISIAQRHGAALYNSAVLLTAYNTAPMRARAGFRLGKLTRCHQSVLVFWKGESEASVPNAGIVPNQAISWE
ncbi:hypothetical protein KFE25_007908 [Diacronema lutheri]|uniref:FHA domain-containing protein n=1 Tax=Diacronema lutheri TaxID=2081491 RepID=A0A8J5XN03_DIALT|nr:hypothetical protein KFE25_007908 [Diacronema lutheri]